MAAVVLGLCIAGAFGSGDFIGGRASASASTVAVLAVGQVFSVAGAVVLVLVVPAEAIGRDVAYGVVAGTVNVVGLGLLYDALARHAAGVVAPVTAVVAAVVPVSWALATGEQPSVMTLCGSILAIAAGGLVAVEHGDPTARSLARGSAQAIVAGAALGSSLVLYAHTSTESGQWPVLAARVAALAAVALVAVAIARQGTLRLPTGHALPLAAGAGVLDVAATALLVVAVRRELVVVVAPFAALAPAFTVVLAWFVDGERMHRAQYAGLMVALAGLVLVAAG